MTSCSQKIQKPCFGAIFTIAGPFLKKEIFPKNLRFVTQNCIRSPNTNEKNMSIPRKVTNGWISGQGWGSKKEKKDAEKCTKDSA